MQTDQFVYFDYTDLGGCVEKTLVCHTKGLRIVMLGDKSVGSTQTNIQAIFTQNLLVNTLLWIGLEEH